MKILELQVKTETILHRINGFWYDSKMEMLTQLDADAIISSESSLFVKLSSDSCGGRGVKHISNEEDIVSEFHKTVAHGKDVVVQRAIKQHFELSKLGESSVNTIRVVSLLSEKKVKIYSSVLRMGIGKSRVDNASSGGIAVGITENGQLKDTAYSMLGVKYDCHPTTKTHFSDITVPSYSRVCNLVEKLHPMIPDFRLVAWDFAIDEHADPILIEVNLCMGSLDFHQLNNGPIFKEDTKKILDEVFNKT